MGRPSLAGYPRARVIATGASGRVWRLAPSGPLSARAFKELLALEKEESRRLEAEFAALALLRHPNVVRVFEFRPRSEDGSAPGYEMEFVDGRDFVAHVRERHPDSFEPLAIESLRALAFLHDLGYLHRDLKPANILVRRDPVDDHRVVFVDFGFAIERRSPSEGHTLGTIPYMAPELFSGHGASRASDVFALGVVFYEALAGRRPFEFRDGNLVAYLDAVERGAPLEDSKLSRYRALLRRMLHADPSKRTASCSELFAVLQESASETLGFETKTTRLARIQSGTPPGRVGALRRVSDILCDERAASNLAILGASGSGKTRLLNWLGVQARQGGYTVEQIEQAPSPGRLKPKSQRHAWLVDDLHLQSSALHDWICDRWTADVDEARLFVACDDQALDHAGLKALLGNPLDDPDWHIERLKPFDREDIKRVAKRSARTTIIADKQVEWILQESGGQPEFVEQIVAAQDWIDSRPGAAREGLVGRIRVAFERLDKQVRGAVWCIALVDVPLSLAAWAELSGIESAVLRSVTMHPGMADLVVIRGDNARPASRWVREVAANAVSRSERERIKRRVGDWVESTGAASISAARRVSILIDCGRPTKAHQIATEESAQFRTHGAFRHAAATTRAILGSLEPGSGAWVSLRRQMADDLFRAEEYRAASRAYSGALRQTIDIESRVEIMVKQAEALARIGHPERATKLADRIRGHAAARRSERLTATGELLGGMACVAAGEWREAIPILERALAISEERGFPEITAAGSLLMNVCLHTHGTPTDRRPYVEAAVRASRAIGRPRDYANSLIASAKLKIDSGMADDDPTQELEEALEVARSHRLSGPENWILAARFTQSIVNEQFEEAMLRAEPLLRNLGRAGQIVRYTEIRSNLLHVLYCLGRHSEVIAVGRRLVARLRDAPPAFANALPETAVVRALIATGEPVDAVIRRAVESAASRPQMLKSNRASAFAARLSLQLRERSDRSESTFAQYCALVDDPAYTALNDQPAFIPLTKADYFRANEEWDRALRHADESLRVSLERGWHFQAARAQVLRAEILERLGRDDDALQAAEDGRASLEKVAARIRDDDLRSDFLNQPSFRRLQQSRRQKAEEERLLAIYEMIRELNSEHEPEWMLEKILDMALRVVDAERGMVLLHDDATDEYRVHLARNLEEETIEDAARFSRNVVLKAAAGEAVLAVDTGTDERFSELRSVSLYGIRSVLCVPLRSRGTIVGAVYLDSRVKGGTFTRDDLHFLEAFADHAALALQNARSRKDLEREHRRLQSVVGDRDRFHGLVGRSDPMQRTYAWIERVAETSLPVLIHGESGTGKELVARAIHATSLRSRRPFLSENCASIAESLLESELFGHVKGAFTGADRDRDGLFQQADGGTLFLDEIGDMPVAMQARLLRVLQEGTVRPVGSNATLAVDVRVVAASHRDLAAEVERGRFREDLLYRLAVLPIDLTPLRDRLGDVPLLIGHFLERIAAERGTAPVEIRQDAVDLLERLPWPGNVRQLLNVLQRLSLVAAPGPITADLVARDEGLAASVDAPPARAPLSLRDNERRQIQAALEACGGNREKAARRLGISRATIFRRIKEFGLGG